MSVRYTSYNKAWCDAIEVRLKKQGARTSTTTENVIHIVSDKGTTLRQVRVEDDLVEADLTDDKKVDERVLYIVESDRELKR